MSLLYRIYAMLIANESSSYLTNSNRKKIELTQKYIHEHLSDETLSVHQLAKICDISEVYFRKIFTQYNNISPIKYIINSRIENAKQLMQCDFLSIDEIAFQSGFSSLSYFYRVFKSVTGTTPNEFRHNINQTFIT